MYALLDIYFTFFMAQWSLQDLYCWSEYVYLVRLSYCFHLILFEIMSNTFLITIKNNF